MLNKEKFLELLEKLRLKSQENKVNWTEAVSSNSRSYSVTFNDGSEISVTYWSPSSAPDVIEAELTTKGRSIITIRSEDGTDEFQALSMLYNEALRSVTGWDIAITEIEKELAGDDDVGNPF